MQYTHIIAVSIVLSSTLVSAFSTPAEKTAQPATAQVAPVQTKKTVKGGSVIELTSEAQLDDLIATGQMIVLDVYRQTCGPCNAFAPVFKATAALFEDVIFVKVNSDNFGALAKKLKISGVPAVFIYKDSNSTPFAQFTGFTYKTAQAFGDYLKSLGA